MSKNYLLPASLLAGTVIGAGMFSLPFVFKSAGLGISLIYLIAAAAAIIMIYLMYADVILCTEGDHRFVGYAEIYLGRGAFWFSILMTIIGMILVLTVYLVLSISFSNLIVSFGTGLEKLLIFWFLGSTAIFLTSRRLALLEFLITGGIIAIIGIIFALGLPNIINMPLSEFSFASGNVLLPLAPILFALSGRVAIPILVRYSRANVRKSVIIGILVPVIVYALFVLGVLALSGVVSEDAVTGLVNAVPDWVLWLVGALGILSLFSSYIVVGVDVRNSLMLDLKFPRWLWFAAIVGGPLAIYLAGFTNFIGLVSFAGGIFITIEAFFIIWMWLNSKRRPTAAGEGLGLHLSLPIILFLFLVFGTALIYEVVKVLI